MSTILSKTEEGKLFLSKPMDLECKTPSLIDKQGKSVLNIQKYKYYDYESVDSVCYRLLRTLNNNIKYVDKKYIDEDSINYLYLKLAEVQSHGDLVNIYNSIG